MNCLDLGDVTLEDGAEWVRRALENIGYRVKHVRRYRRMITMKLGLFERVYIVRHESVRRTIVCGSRDVIEALKGQGAITEYRLSPTADERARPLIEAQILERKTRNARNDLIISSVLAAGLAAALAIMGASPHVYALLIIVIAAMDSVPRTALFTGHTEFYIPIMYPIYRKRLERLRKSLLSKGGEYCGGASDQPDQVSG